MNKNEQKAFNWLLKQGIPQEDIYFHHKGTPDFTTPLGSEEPRVATIDELKQANQIHKPQPPREYPPQKKGSPLKFPRKIKQIGGSKGVLIPMVILSTLKLKTNDDIIIYLDNSKIIIEKWKKGETEK